MHTRVLDTLPDLIALAAQDSQAFPCLLQSSGAEGYDLLFALPREVRVFSAGQGAPLQAALAALPVVPGAQATALPFTGGWVCYLGYEWLETLEPSVPPRPDAHFPVGWLARVPAAVIVERATQRAMLAAETADELETLATRIQAASGSTTRHVVVEALKEDPPQTFLDGVARSKHYIREGDVFQVNLSRGWDGRLSPEVRPIDVFARLRQTNPAPFSAWLQLDRRHAIVSSSPERLVRVGVGGRVETRPIAGTHPRAADPQEDRRQRERLIASTKERAEHIMLIDLERNDLGRIAVPGSVRVDELMAVTSYTYVHHIESTVSATLAPGHSVADVARALFPGGTITGCPKVRCMQIIRELEDRPRAAYTGSLGYINRDGTMDLNILIRTFMQTDDRLYFRAGAGIVADSDPARELEETRAKARGLLRALGVAG